ncbi:MAG: ThuA domain-containing protein [Leptolyngbya sp. PLA2]|nr:ThuA domain-containing protein [Leptolyngbya sp.]MCE7970707.1 ThuA domain-containing protein [Leptolyngbya sp. PL-A2]MCQ3939861.1 ThuA domain-containing protein [cyanobacterium CYA1]MCZ7633431.1 ThuA domain-containing protein [Phycisphaerales bacterium]MDL1903393.1 ThuA domain-containing protein [Synechococcales cyanobacterium CNB]GIK18092.1 MAG: hypothetical protein BroJett004_02560 [Planctomycetota bacterium]
MVRLMLVSLLSLLGLMPKAALASMENGPEFRVLLYSRTAGFRHGSIAAGIAAVTKLGEKHGFVVDATEDPSEFTDENLERYAVVLFLNTTGTVLDAEQKAAFERFIAKGRGWVGVHSASDTEYEWPWYAGLVGAYFKGHPAIQEATILVHDRDHPSTKMLPERWVRTDEWYTFRDSPRGRVHVLMSVDERTYEGGGMGDDHPIAWCHEYRGGRAWYTALGHTNESYEEPLFLEHLLGGIRWAAGVEEGAPAQAPAGTPVSSSP